MRRLHFRLTLEPGLEAVVRLLQLHQYATDLVDGERVLIGPALRERMVLNFPAREPSDVLDSLLGKGPVGWTLSGQEQGGSLVVISTEGPGVSFSAIGRILEQVAPEAFLMPIAYEPTPGNSLTAHSKALH